MTSETHNLFEDRLTNLPEGLELNILEYADEHILNALYKFFCGLFDKGEIENFESFRETIGVHQKIPTKNKVIYVCHDDQILGALLGTFLPKTKIGMILYSAVNQTIRSRGIYTQMRGALIRSLLSEIPSGPDYIISELPIGSRLYTKYIRDWGAFVAPCNYEIPETQGLYPRKIALMLQPIKRLSAPSNIELAAIIKEIYSSVYQLPLTNDTTYRRVLSSIHQIV